jgi:hypothetical protein
MTDGRIRRNATVSTAATIRSCKHLPRRCQRAPGIALYVWLGASVTVAGQSSDIPRPEQERLRAVVETLASPEFGGRSGPVSEKSVSYLIEKFRGLSLAPLFEGNYVQPIPGKETGTVIGHNVGALLRGSDAMVKGEFVIVAAHFDHLGVRGGKLYPGADDNASGVAMMLEVARSLVKAPSLPRRSVIFIGFDLEEIGLFGSRYFVAHAPVALDKVVLFVTADMIGRSLAGVCDSYVFVMGAENAPGLRPWIDRAAQGRSLTVGLLGADFLVLNRSDYGPFRSRGIPFLFFTTGENPRYHRPEDTAETLDFSKLTSISQMIERIIATAADAPAVPRWQKNPDNPFDEAVTIRNVLRLFVTNRDTLKLGAPQLFLINNLLGTLDGIVERGSITADERARVLQAGRVVLFTVL